MGTRADFYVGRGKDAEWIGSIGYDGYPDGMPDHILRADKVENFREAVAQFIASDDSATTPEDGWPWPWEDSRTTDYAYAFDDGAVWASGFGCAWFKAAEPEPERDGPKVAEFPNMRERQNVTFGKRSGLLMIALPPERDE